MNKLEYQSNGQPVAIDFAELREKLGYKTYKPRIGSVGRALIKAVKEGNRRSIGWLKLQLDELFKKDRKAQFRRKKKEPQCKQKIKQQI